MDIAIIVLGIAVAVALIWVAVLTIRLYDLQRELQLERSRLRKHISDGPPHPQYPPDALTYVSRAELNAYLEANLEDHNEFREWMEQRS